MLPCCQWDSDTLLGDLGIPTAPLCIAWVAKHVFAPVHKWEGLLGSFEQSLMLTPLGNQETHLELAGRNRLIISYLLPLNASAGRPYTQLAVSQP